MPRASESSVAWALTAAAVLVQICYPLTPETMRTEVTVASVLVFCAASVTDVVRVHGPRGGVVLVLDAAGGGLAVEAVGMRTGVPFGSYAYSGDLGPALLGVPLVVPLAWTMMAWPALVVGRALAARVSGPRAAVVPALGGWALAAWDVFLDPQMVDAGHWRWADPEPALPLVPGIPLTNYAGWLLVAGAMVAVAHRLLPDDRDARPSGPAAALYLWTYASSVVAHTVFFGRPGAALAGGVLMGLVAIPFVVALRQVTALRRR
jgi:putative membrane protein